MSSSAPVGAKNNTNFIQRNLIPEDSRYVRYFMIKAADFGCSENLLFAHVVSVSCAVFAVALSAFNSISYLLQVPAKIILNIFRLNPIRAVTDFVGDLSDMAKSLLFVSLGVTLVAAGLFLPAAIFTHFCPEYYKSREERQEEELERANAKIRELDTELKEKDKGHWFISMNYEKEIERLKRGWRNCFGLL